MNLKKHFEEAKKTVVEKVWGREYWVVNGEYCGKLFELFPHSESSLHMHKLKNETFMALEGLVQVETWPSGVDRMGEITLLRGWAKDSIDIPAGLPHRFSNYENSVAWVVEFSSHHDDQDVFRFEESRRLI